MTRINTRWRCNNCYAIHDSEFKATDCCPVDVQKVYQCLDCGEWHDNEDEAQECCGEQEGQP